MAAKKNFAIIFIVLALAVLAGLGYFLVFPKNAQTFENKTPLVRSAPELNSFRGVLADVLRNTEAKAGEIREKIAEAIPNPFVSEKKEAADENKFVFAVLGDTQYFTAGNSRGNFQKTVAQINKINPDLVISVGDLIGNCKGKKEDAQDYADWKNALGALFTKTYAVQGNHDRVENVDKCDRFWTDIFNFPIDGPDGFAEFAYSLDIKNSHFVFLDTNKPDAHEINSIQRNWLEQDLAKNKKENTFVVFHEPAYPVSDKKGEGLDADPSERNSLWEIIDKYNVTGVFNGHEHIVSRRKIDSKVSSVAKNSVYQFVFGNTDSFDHDLPSAGVAEYANQGQGRFGLVKVNGKETTVETHGPDGTLLNTFTFSK
ncbi:MAG: Metallophosphoesterase [Candidatus Moranbacteria bacterium GW2011_GWC1_45_18]|nr:MAG: Metallophosphoesterase [Candidatus Moranbacteria bacterium GW2011_GWC2_40_12]KKT33795.1 MAG: Metallophosphoesterase [Candidatus Moranbacteria bacterium GW2011_GWF2_44_10]KKT70089.1 MAG: Metallophosphoesterase [Candidatus Moranbacteria bacterium GW2011_GWF1_44_4]KKU00894.1 MAG: Metallophosphoesterase [Candidatus Moranbacteria bacterium GW2011_GWC1_45_18]OGI40330.1 MAG: hypothetical protein A2374_04155 [Candidatus Moranbacteria bacterium RIFOXYB1_FULL_44_23]OGI43310.1 MAG: hypothetical p